MKMIAYSVKDDERPFFKDWSEKNNIDVHLITDDLTEDTVDLSRGYDGVIGFQTKPYSRETFDRLSQNNINFLSIRNVGTDNIDLQAATDNNIKVTNVPSYSPNAIAEHAVTLAMGLLRKMKIFNKKIEHDNFEQFPDIAREMRNETVGIVGTGRIGATAARIFKGFGAKVIAYDQFHNDELAGIVDYVDNLDDLFKQATVVSLHVPGTDENKYLIDKDTIELMPRNTIIVNTARGNLIDTTALIDALDNNKIAGAGLDTYENEVGIFNFKEKKLGDNKLKKLIDMDNVIVTPHIAYYTDEAVKNMVKIALDSNLELQKKGKSKNQVN